MKGIRQSCFVAAGFLVAGLAGCQKSSHTVTRTYDYSDQGRAPVQPIEVTYEAPPSEYRMTSPGEMASPGEMVGPGRMVVEPRRNP